MSSADDRDEIASICASLGVGATPQQIDSLSTYLQLLSRWNATYNLTAVRDPGQMRVQHLADCVAVVTPMRRERVEGRVLDVGSGGGLPGIVIATLMPEVDVTCIDTVGKKAAFVRQAAGAMSLANLRSVHGRVETVEGVGLHDVITSRAFSSLADFTRLSRARLARGGRWMAMKGREPLEELRELPSDVEVFHVEQLSVPGMEGERRLVWLRPRVCAEPAAN